MKTFKEQGSNNLKRISWPIILFMTLLFLLLAWLANYYKNEQQYVVVKSYGKGAIINLSKNYNTISFPSTSNKFGAVLAENGDLLEFNSIPILYSNPEIDSIKINYTKDSIIYVNGKLNSLLINKKVNLLSWFQKMKSSEIDNLATIIINDKIPGNYLGYLKEIASQKPNINLVFENYNNENNIEDYLQHAAFFSPHFIKISLNQKQLNLLKNFNSIECLYLNLSDSVITKPLPKIIGLKQCIINGNNLKSLDKSFFVENPQLEKISLFGCLNDYSALRPLKKLTEIVLTNSDCKADLSPIKDKLPQLSVILLSGTFSSIDLLANYHNIKWLGLPENTTQTQLNTFCSQLKNLQILQINGNDSIKNLEPLKELTNLRGLVIEDSVSNLKSLNNLKSLRYLSLSEKNMKDSLSIQKLKISLPGCIIVPNSGACMGSGWLLLLIPLVLIFSLIIIKKSQKH